MSNASHDLAISAKEVGVRLHKRYGFLGLNRTVHWALENITFDLRRGEVLGVLGRNGSGKSTLLRTLAGIINPDRGQIVTFGHSVCLLSLAVGFMPQLTGRQNAILSGMLMGRTRKEMEALLPEIQEFSEIGDWLEVPVSTYSSGMRQRLAFSVALQVRTDVLLLDEILSVGDEGFRAKSQSAMQDLIVSGRTVVLVSNNSEAIERLCDRALWVEGGRSMHCGESGMVRMAYLNFIQATKDQGGRTPSDSELEDIICNAETEWQNKKTHETGSKEAIR